MRDLKPSSIYEPTRHLTMRVTEANQTVKGTKGLIKCDYTKRVPRNHDQLLANADDTSSAALWTNAIYERDKA